MQDTEWQPGSTVELNSFTVSLSTPVEVLRSKGYCWFPSLVVLPNGDLYATASNYADVHTSDSNGFNTFSSDGGLTWSEPVVLPYGESPLQLANGDVLLLPYYLHERPGGMGSYYKRVPAGTHELLLEDVVVVRDWPRPDKPILAEQDLRGFVFNGQAIPAEGGYLATLYGYFEGSERSSLVVAHSADGKKWSVRAIIADDKTPFEGSDGPSEASLCRLQDGRIMVIYRLASAVPFCQAFSSDEGKSWTAPRAMEDVFSVQPSTVRMVDGTVALSGGRPGIFLWLNPDKRGEKWEKIDLRANHNATRPDVAFAAELWSGTTAYTEVVALDENTLMVIYDRAPHGWEALPADSKETNSVWVVRAHVTRK